MFDVFQKVKKLKRKLSASFVNELKAQYAEGYNAGCDDGPLKADLLRAIGSSTDHKLIDAVGDLVAEWCSSMMLKDKKVTENIVFEVMKLTHEHYLCTPPCFSNGIRMSSDITANNAIKPIKRAVGCIKAKNVQGKVLFPDGCGTDSKACEGFQGMNSLEPNCSSHGKVQKLTINIEDDEIVCDGAPVNDVMASKQTSQSVFLSDSKDYYGYVEKCFNGAASVLPLPLCSALFFPVLHCGHWFLFIVDFTRKMFLFLDSFFSKSDGFSVHTRNKLVAGFCHAWDSFVFSDVGLNDFCLAYTRVPKQENKKDCGIFVMKYMQMWKPAVSMINFFSPQYIPNIRIQLVSQFVIEYLHISPGDQSLLFATHGFSGHKGDKVKCVTRVVQHVLEFAGHSTNLVASFKYVLDWINDIIFILAPSAELGALIKS